MLLILRDYLLYPLPSNQPLRLVVVPLFLLVPMIIYAENSMPVNDREVNVDLINIIMRLNQNETKVMVKGNGRVHPLISFTERVELYLLSFSFFFFLKKKRSYTI